MEQATEIALTIVFIVLGFVHASIASTWFLRRRHMFPISGRDTALVMVLVVSQLVSITLGGISRSIIREPCGWVAYFDTVFGNFPLAAAVANGIRIWFKYNIARDKMKDTRGHFLKDISLSEQPEKGESSSKVYLSQSNELKPMPSSSKGGAQGPAASQSWYIRHEHWMTSRTLLTWTLGFSTVAGIALVAMYVAALLSPNPPDPTDAGCEVKSQARNFVLAFSGICFIFFAITIRQLRGIEDGFGLKFENTLVCATLIVSIPITWLLSSSGYPFYSYMMRIATSQFRFLYLLDYPLWRSYYSPLAKRSRNLSHCASRSRLILKVLHHPEYAAEVESFKAHLVKEFSSESLLFYYEAHRFEDVAHASGESFETDSEIDTETQKQGNACGTDGDTPLANVSSNESADDVEPNRVANVTDANGDSQSSTHPDKVHSPEESTDDHQRMIANFAMTIYCEYIDPNSLSQLNIDDTVTGTITQKLRAAITNFDEIRESIPKKSVLGVPKLPATEYLNDERTTSMVVRNCVVCARVDPNVFCEAKEKVLSLLEYDPFLRWKRAKNAIEAVEV